jgi:cation diffusion facilitator CzcD-associated flavoprotein CzcO
MSELHEIIIIGTGFAGLGMAIQLREAGIEDFVLLERAGEIGGTWRDNHYPGCACDVQSLLYSFSFAPNPHWTRAYAGQPEIQSYLLDCVARYELRPKIELGAEIVEARWDESSSTWSLATRDGRRYRARVLVSAIGALSNPAYPDIPGLDSFAGTSFHSADWDHDYELANKRVAVIGTGASAIQFVPRIAPEVARLDLYQRTPPWVLPKADRAFTPLERAAHAHLPGFAATRRALIYWQLEARVLGFTRYPRIMSAVERLAARHIARQVPDPELRAKLTPDYTLGCKRILIANDYYPALTRPNVEVVTDGIERVTPSGVVDSSGREREVDAIIFGTGFRVQDLVRPGAFVGREGLDLAASWRARPEAYKGTCFPGFPNLFMLAGPNTGIGHNSMVYILESQIAYVLDAVRQLRQGGWTSVEVREDAHVAFNEELRSRSTNSVWQTGCHSWYLDEQGRNTTLWPDFTFRFRRLTARFDTAAYHVQAEARATVPRGPELAASA